MTTDIAGRFTIADLTSEYLAVGFIGSAWADSLTPAQLDHVRGFYGMTGKRSEVWSAYPVSQPLQRLFDYLPGMTRPLENGGDPRLIILFIILLPLMVIWELAKKS